MQTTRILLADDHEVVRHGLRALLESHPGWEVSGEASDGRAAVKLADTIEPDIVVLDLSMPELNGFDAARKILRKRPRTKILILSMHESEQLVREVLSVGVLGYVLKSDAGAELLAAVEALLAGDTFFRSQLAARIYETEFRAIGRILGRGKSKGSLTPREREIAQLLAEGRTNKEVAGVLDISVKTAETHRARIMRKLEVDSVADLVRYAIRNGLISP